MQIKMCCNIQGGPISHGLLANTKRPKEQTLTHRLIYMLLSSCVRMNMYVRLSYQLMSAFCSQSFYTLKNTQIDYVFQTYDTYKLSVQAVPML